MLPPHNSYVEPFGGAAWVLFRKKPSKIEVYNDINGDLVNLFLVVRDNIDEFIEKQQYLLHSRELHRKFQRELDDGLDEVEKAVRFYYVICASFAGRYQSGWGHTIKNSHSYYCPDMKELKQAHARLKRVFIEQLDFADCISRYDTEDTLFYIDPPYFMPEDKFIDYYGRFIPLFRGTDHIRLLNVIKRIKGKFILSYNDCYEVREWYNDFNIIETKPIIYSSKPEGDKHATELIITNYDVGKQSRIIDFSFVQSSEASRSS